MVQNRWFNGMYPKLKGIYDILDNIRFAEELVMDISVIARLIERLLHQPLM